MKLAEKDKYWLMYADVWNNLHKKFISRVDWTETFWDELTSTAIEISKKYQENEFVKSLVLNELFEFERIWKASGR